MRQTTQAGSGALPEAINKWLSADTLQIYPWPRPRPTDLTQLSEAMRRWKQQQDTAETTRDVGADADDWQDWAGNASFYESTHRFYSCIASSFVVRAKRAFKAGKPWTDFVRAELQEDSESEARLTALKRPKMREVIMEEALNNDIRLAVFEVLAPRLCAEVWLEPYSRTLDDALSTGDDEDGVLGGGAKQDSKLEGLMGNVTL